MRWGRVSAHRLQGGLRIVDRVVIKSARCLQTICLFSEHCLLGSCLVEEDKKLIALVGQPNRLMLLLLLVLF